MQAGEKGILKFMDGHDKKFIIPVYQRPYSWKRDNCLQLMKDLADVYKNNRETHFFGSIVYVVHNNGDYDEYSIIDGQQRITTVSLLLLAIMNYVRENQLTVQGINTDKIKKAYLIDEYDESEKKLKLKLVQNDDAAYDALLKGNEPIENTSVTANYNCLYEEITKLSLEDLSGLYKAVGKLMVVSISLQPENGDDPQLIFESLNSTGLDLEVSDKVRNYVLMGMKNKEQEKFFNQYWKPLEKLVTPKEMNKFIRYYLEVKTRSAISEDRVYTEFKLLHQSHKLSMDSLMKDMMEYASYYNEINYPVEENKAKTYRKVLQRLNKLEVKTSIPLCMDLFKANHDGALPEDEFCKALKLIENYLVRREICDLQTNALNKVFIQLGAEIEKDVEEEDKTYFQAFCNELMKRSGKSRFPNDHDFADKFSTYDLYNAKGTVRKYILESLENYQNREQVAVEELLSDGTLTIEHVMPQTLTPEWKKELGPTWELIHAKYKDTIGNLTLTAYNSDYSNSGFIEKRDMKDKGFKCSKLFLNSYIGKCEHWGRKEILERADILFKKAVKFWWMPNVELKDSDSEEWIDWDDDFDATNKIVSQVRIKNRVIKTSNVTDAFKKVHRALFEMDPTVYHENGFNWISENEDSLRTPYKIAAGVYIETNKSSEAKFSYIKKVAELMKLDSSDIRFLLHDKKVKGDFDITKEETFGNIPVGQLAYKLFADLILRNAISAEEVEGLKSKVFTQKQFSGMYYPVLANQRNDNQGNSANIRYRKQPLIFEGSEVYITTQWFEINRQELITWYHDHLRIAK